MRGEFPVLCREELVLGDFYLVLFFFLEKTERGFPVLLSGRIGSRGFLFGFLGFKK